MKQTSIIIAKALAVLVVSSLLLSLIFSLLYQFNLLRTSNAESLTLILGSITYLLAGAYIGSQIQRKALLHSMGIGLALILLSLCFNPWTWSSIARCLLKGFMFNLGCMLIHLIKQKNRN